MPWPSLFHPSCNLSVCWLPGNETLHLIENSSPGEASSTVVPSFMPCGSVLDFVSYRITKGYTLNTHTYANTQNRVNIWNIYLLILDIPPRNKFKAPYFLSSISKKTERVTNSISSTESPFSLFNNSGVSTSSPLLTLEPLFSMSLWNSLYFIQHLLSTYYVPRINPEHSLWALSSESHFLQF